MWGPGAWQYGLVGVCVRSPVLVPCGHNPCQAGWLKTELSLLTAQEPEALSPAVALGEGPCNISQVLGLQGGV